MLYGHCQGGAEVERPRSFPDVSTALVFEQQPSTARTMKREADSVQGPEIKRLRRNAPSYTWACRGNLPRILTELDLTAQQTDEFLKQIGVCAGVHAASDAQSRKGKSGQGLLVGHQDWQGLPEHTWRCCAELNVLLRWYSNRLSEIPLAGYHSWTRAPKATTFHHVVQGCQNSEHPQAWVQLQMVSHLLHSMLSDEVDLAISKSTIALHSGCPAWLQSWCLRWGFTGQRVSILTLEAYAAGSSIIYDFLGHPMEPCTSAVPSKTLYVPCCFEAIDA